MTFDTRPARMTLSAIDTADTVPFQYNPTKIEETLTVAYSRITIPGLSHQVLHYTNTNNLSVTFDLAFDALVRSEYPSRSVKEAHAFLMSLCYPRAGASSIKGGAPPRALFVFPGTYELTSVLTELKTERTRFARTGETTAAVFTVKIEQISDFRITSEAVRRNGVMRPDLEF